MDDLFAQYHEMVEEDAPVNKSKTSFLGSMMNFAASLPLLRSVLGPLTWKNPEVERLIAQQKAATTYLGWYDVSVQLDEILGNNAWKLDPVLESYDHLMLQSNLERMRSARLKKDYKLLIYLIRTRWTRNLGNMGDKSLYRRSHVGTKRLIEEYIEECCLSLDFLMYDRKVQLEDRYLLGMLIQTRKNIGRTALVLSGGSTFGIFHIGVLICLIENNLLPRIISGSSAGLIMASILCCHTNEEIVELMRSISDRTFNIFDGLIDSKASPEGLFKLILNKLGHFLKYGTLYDMTGLVVTMKGFVGELTFREAYNRTGKILNITVSPASIHEQTRLLNYLTAPHCLIWLAVCASCSLPGIFPSTSIYEKTPHSNEVHEWNNDASMKYVDGSVYNDLPITRLSEMFNVDHIIAVQVNPHVVPVLKVSISSVGGEIENDLNYKFKQFLNNVYDFTLCELVHYFQILNEMDVSKNLCSKIISILSQNYSGDITILPNYKLADFIGILINPSAAFILDFIVRGVRAAWPKMTVIKNHCGVEFALDKAITVLRGRLITSASKLHHSRRSTVAMNPDGGSIQRQTGRNKSILGVTFAANNVSEMHIPKFASGFRSIPRKQTLIRNMSYNASHPIVSSPVARRSGSVAYISSLSLSILQKLPRSPKRPRRNLLRSPILKKEYASAAATNKDHSTISLTLLSPTTKGDMSKSCRETVLESCLAMGNIRKAKSSGNIKESHDLQNQPLSKKPTPGWMFPPINSFAKEPDDVPGKPMASIQLNKANYPSTSGCCSRKNSYIGLSWLNAGHNRLPDTMPTRKSQPRLFDTSQEVIKSLQSPDLRRSLTLGLMKGYAYDKSLSLNGIQQVKEFRVKWELGRSSINVSSPSSDELEEADRAEETDADNFSIPWPSRNHNLSSFSDDAIKLGSDSESSAEAKSSTSSSKSPNRFAGVSRQALSETLENERVGGSEVQVGRSYKIRAHTRVDELRTSCRPDRSVLPCSELDAGYNSDQTIKLVDS